MYYKDTHNKLHFIEKIEDATYLPSDCVAITDDEAGIIRLAENPLPTQEEIKSSMWKKIKTERDRRTEIGGFNVGTKWYHSDSPSRIKLLSLVLMGLNIPPNLQWKTMDNTFITMTPTLAGKIFGAAASNDIAIFTAAETHKATMELSSDPSNYDFTTGWPTTFGE